MTATSGTDRIQWLRMCFRYEYSALHLYLLLSEKFRILWKDEDFDLYRLIWIS